MGGPACSAAASSFCTASGGDTGEEIIRVSTYARVRARPHKGAAVFGDGLVADGRRLRARACSITFILLLLEPSAFTITKAAQPCQTAARSPGPLRAIIRCIPP